MSEKKDLAHKDYLKGMKYKDIAEKYGVTINTVKSWKVRYKWSRVGVRTKEKSVHTKKERKPIIQNDELNDKQKMFCLYYLKYFNATKAYQKAYGCDYFTANANGSRLLVNASIEKEIKRLKAERQQGVFLDAQAVLQKYIDIAFADITDFAEFGKKEVQAMGASGPLEDDEGNPVMVEINYVAFKESAEVDGTIITEVKKGKDGVSIKLVDKMRALEFLSKYTDLLSEGDQKRLQKEKLKLDIEKTKAEIDNLTDPNDDKPIEIVIKRKQ